MKATYTGRTENLTPAQQKKLDAKFSKLAKLLDRRGGERDAHIILTAERHQQRAEITVRFHDHPLVGIGASSDQFNAIITAADKLEKQVLKLRTKWRDTKRGPKESWAAPAGTAGEEPVSAEPVSEKRVYRVNQHARRKPMTLDEAVLEMEGKLDYLVYRDAETDRLSVLLRRRDGDYDLVEA